MATYTASNDMRDTVVLVLSRAEAEALRDLAAYAEPYIGEPLPMNHMRRGAAERAMSALSAATNTSARRAGFFD